MVLPGAHSVEFPPQRTERQSKKLKQEPLLRIRMCQVTSNGIVGRRVKLKFILKKFSQNSADRILKLRLVSVTMLVAFLNQHYSLKVSVTV